MRYRYWDSCVILGWLKAEPEKLIECEAGIRLAERGELTIITSALTITEVLKLKGDPPISKADREKVRGFFENDYIAIYDVDRTVAEKAQDVLWDHGVKPKDAIHVATALLTAQNIAIEQLDTFDEPLVQRSGQVGGEPPLKIGLPDFQTGLFSSA